MHNYTTNQMATTLSPHLVERFDDLMLVGIGFQSRSHALKHVIDIGLAHIRASYDMGYYDGWIEEGDDDKPR